MSLIAPYTLLLMKLINHFYIDLIYKYSLMIKKIYKSLLLDKYIKDIFFQGSGNSIAQMISILILPILSRIYNPEDFGIFNIFTQFTALMGILLTFRLEYFVLLNKSNIEISCYLKKIFSLSLILTLFYSIIFLLFHQKITFFSEDITATSYFILCPLAGLAFSFSILFQQLVQREEDFKTSGLSEIINKMFYGITALMGFFYKSVIFLLMSTVLGPLSKAIFLFKKSNSEIVRNSFSNSIVGKIKKEIVKNSISFSTSSLIQFFIGILPILYITKNFSITTLGHFSLVISCLYLPTSLLGNALGQVYFQRSSSLYHEKKSFWKIWIKTFKTVIYVGIPVYFIVYLFSPELFPLVFGEEWVDAGRYASIFSIASFFNFISIPMDRTSFILNKNWYPVCWNLLRLITVSFVIVYSLEKELNFLEFLNVYIIQISLMYLIDLIFNMVFVKNTQ
jgi:teichuronic acid exporter